MNRAAGSEEAGQASSALWKAFIGTCCMQGLGLCSLASAPAPLGKVWEEALQSSLLGRVGVGGGSCGELSHGQRAWGMASKAMPDDLFLEKEMCSVTALLEFV